MHTYSVRWLITRVHGSGVLLSLFLSYFLLPVVMESNNQLPITETKPIIFGRTKTEILITKLNQ